MTNASDRKRIDHWEKVSDYKWTITTSVLETVCIIPCKSIRLYFNSLLLR